MSGDDLVNVLKFSLHLMDKSNVQIIKAGSGKWNESRIKLMETLSDLHMNNKVRFQEWERQLSKRIVKMSSDMLTEDIRTIMGEDSGDDDDSDEDSDEDQEYLNKV